MKGRDFLHSRTTYAECSQIPHMIYSDDFNTNYPNPNRIDRIAREVDEYLKWKHKREDTSEKIESFGEGVN